MKLQEDKLAKKFEVIRLFSEGFSERQIQEKIGVAKSTIHDTISKYKKYNTVLRLRGSGRPLALDKTDVDVLLCSVENDPKKSSKKLSVELEKTTGKKVTDRTIQSVLKKSGVHSRVPRKIPSLSIKNISKRLEKAKEWTNWSIRQWENVLFSDETKINLFSSDGRIKVWKRSKECLTEKNSVSTIKHGGGGIMIWGCMSSSGVGKLVFIDSTMDKYHYKRILSENLLSSSEILGLGDKFIFQQDNDPKHTSRYVQDFFEKNNINVLEWPSQSPDLNPIEHLWDHVKREVRKYSPKTKKELKERVIQIWNDIPVDLCKKLINTMPRRIEEVVRSKGKHTSF